MIYSFNTRSNHEALINLQCTHASALFTNIIIITICDWPHIKDWTERNSKNIIEFVNLQLVISKESNPQPGSQSEPLVMNLCGRRELVSNE